MPAKIIPMFNPRLKPTPEQMKRAELADMVFALHSDLNKILSRTAFELIEGANVEIAINHMLAQIRPVVENAAVRIREKGKL